jgi:DNA-binding transcriptional LysR family regulator
MDSFIYLSAFVRAVEVRNFSEAGQQLSMCALAIARAIARLNDRYRIRPFRRSTHSIVFTHVFRLFRLYLRLSGRVDPSIAIVRAAAKGHGK